MYRRPEGSLLYCEGFCCRPGIAREVGTDLLYLAKWIVTRKMPSHRSWLMVCKGHRIGFCHLQPCYGKRIRYVI